MDTKDYTILRVRKETHRLFKRIAAMSDESIVQTLERLARQEWARIQEAGKDVALHKDQD